MAQRRVQIATEDTRDQHPGPGWLYVAETLVPAALHGPANARQQVDQPEEYGFHRAYWRSWHDNPQPNAERRPLGLMLVAELFAADLTEAEDLAISGSQAFAEFVAFFAGGPVNIARLSRIARVDAEGVLEEQWVYYYDSESAPTVRLDPPQLRAFLGLASKAPSQAQERMRRAIHWYGSSVSDQSKPDAYLAAWIGLESLGPRLHALFHVEGDRVACSVCGNEGGKKRDAKVAGLEHLFRMHAPETLEQTPFKKLSELRDDIAHGLRSSPAELRERVGSLLPDIQLCLAVGILLARHGIRKDPTFGWHAALPRDYEVRPDARDHVRPQGTVRRKPYSGDWVSVTRSLEDVTSNIDGDGIFEMRGKARVGVARRRSEPEPERSYVGFKRRGRTNTLDDPRHPEAGPIEWRERALSAAWLRQGARRESSSD